MSSTRDPDRIFRAWLEEMPDEAPDRAITAVLQAIERTSQLRRPLFAIGRFQPMNRLPFAAVAAVVAAILVGGALILTRTNAPNVGGPSQSPSAAAATPTAAPTFPPTVPTAARLWGDWVADAPPIPGLTGQGPRIQLSIAWHDPQGIWVQLDYATGVQALNSLPIAAPDGQLGLVSPSSSVGCPPGAVGRYRWDRSADGLFLTLSLVTDDCSLRATTLARTWVHTLSAVTDGGHGVLPVMNISATLPARRFGLAGADFAGDLTTFDSTPFVGMFVAKDPIGFGQPCSATDRKPMTNLTTMSAVVAYIRGLPGYTFATGNVLIGGHPGIHITATSKTGTTCAAGDVGLFSASGLGDANGATSPPGNRLSLWVTEVDNNAWVFWYRGDQVSAADEVPVIQSIGFLTALPLP